MAADMISRADTGDVLTVTVACRQLWYRAMWPGSSSRDLFGATMSARACEPACWSLRLVRTSQF